VIRALHIHWFGHLQNFIEDTLAAARAEDVNNVTVVIAMYRLATMHCVTDSRLTERQTDRQTTL